MTARADCRAPDACRAKGAGLCRTCAGHASMAAIRADPVRDALRIECIAAASRTPERQAISRASADRNNADPVTRARIAANGRTQVEIIARRRLERSAAALGVPLDLLPEVRRLQTKGFSATQAASLLRRSLVVMQERITQSEVVQR